MKRPGLQTQNQRNKRKDGDADRWPDASFFGEGKNLFPSCHISNGEGNKKGQQRNALLANVLRLLR